MCLLTSLVSKINWKLRIIHLCWAFIVCKMSKIHHLLWDTLLCRWTRCRRFYPSSLRNVTDYTTFAFDLCLCVFPWIPHLCFISILLQRIKWLGKLRRWDWRLLSRFSVDPKSEPPPRKKSKSHLTPPACTVCEEPKSWWINKLEHISALGLSSVSYFYKACESNF